MTDGAVAHRLEQAAHNRLVVGSTPTSPTRRLCCANSTELTGPFDLFLGLLLIF